MTPQPESPKQLQYLVTLEILRALLRWLYTLAVFGGCTYLVFWRGESGWLYLPACLLLWFRREL